MLCISSITKIVAEIKLVDLWLGVTGVQVQGFCLPVCRWQLGSQNLITVSYRSSIILQEESEITRKYVLIKLP